MNRNPTVSWQQSGTSYRLHFLQLQLVAIILYGIAAVGEKGHAFYVEEVPGQDNLGVNPRVIFLPQVYPNRFRFA